MNVLIIAAHGSRKAASNREVEKLAMRLSNKTHGLFDQVVYSFLQFAQPLLEEKISHLVENGARNLVVFPFFIGAGSHITEDIPALVQHAKKVYPHVSISLTRHLGAIESIEDVILAEVKNPGG